MCIPVCGAPGVDLVEAHTTWQPVGGAGPWTCPVWVCVNKLELEMEAYFPVSAIWDDLGKGWFAAPLDIGLPAVEGTRREGWRWG